MDFNEMTQGQLINLADSASVHSDDPVTQVGAVIFGTMQGRTGLVHACNALPPGIKRDTNTLGGRAHVAHAEALAIAYAAGGGLAIGGSTMVSSRFPCYDCAALILAAGISCLVTRPFDEETPLSRETYRMEEAYAALIEGGIDVQEVPVVPFRVFDGKAKELN